MDTMKLLGKVMIAASILMASASVFAAPVNVNTADAKTLSANISGIGPKKAEAIIAYRNEKGPFKSIKELINVKGIGLKIIEKNKADLLVTDVARKSTKKSTARN